MSSPGVPWRRLSAWMIVVRPLHEIVGVLPVLALFVLLGEGDPQRLAWSGVALVLLLLRGFVLWWRTSYRVTDEHVELHAGLLRRTQRAVRRDRVRTVENTAKFGHRLFGLAEVHIGTGESAGNFELDAVTATEADGLRAELLRPGADATEGSAVVSGTTGAEGAPGALLATLDWRWLRYAPLTLSGAASIGVALATVMRLMNEIDEDGNWVASAAQGAVGWLSQYPLVLDLLAGVVLVAVLVTVVSLAGYVVSYAHYRLSREADGTLRVRRGLLTTRSVSIEEARLRGVRMRQEPLLRAAGAARLTGITTGLSHTSDSSLLVPPAPLKEVHRVAADAVRAPRSPMTALLAGHPRQALRRRLVRAVGTVLGLAVVAGGLRLWADWPDWPWITALCLIPFAALLGVDRYRALGHALSDRYLITRTGSLRRNTDALQRTGIIGWKVQRSFFQRRAGLLTLGATTAAGHGNYEVIDVGEQEGLRLAEETVPGLFGHLLIHEPTRNRDP